MGANSLKIDVIIPTYKPGKEFYKLLDSLQKQKLPVNKIIIMNTEKKYLYELTAGKGLEESYPNVEVHHISLNEFDHGATRHAGVQFSSAEIFICMTQDAMPADELLTEQLVHNLSETVASAYARQLPSQESNELERCSRYFNYPDSSVVKTKDDLNRLGVKTYFCSNVCAAYRRDVYDKLGGFIQRTIFNEDMIYAAAVIKAGYAISYEAEARVIHSHNYNNIQQLRRNFDLGISQADHPEVFRDVPSESEGKKLVKETCKYLSKHGKVYLIPVFFMQCCFKYLGYLLGKNYKKLPLKWVVAISTNKGYWRTNPE